MATSPPVDSNRMQLSLSSIYPQEGTITTDVGVKHITLLGSTSKCVVIACIVGSIGIVFIALGIANICGPTGSVGFIASVAGGSALTAAAIGGVIWITIIHYKNQKTHSPAPSDISTNSESITPVEQASSDGLHTVIETTLNLHSPDIHPGITKPIISLRPKKINNPIYQYPVATLRGPREAWISFEGYNTARLMHIHQTIEAREIPLNVCPKRPERSYPMDHDKAAAYVELLPPELQPIAQKAINHAKYISMAHFDYALHICMMKLNAELATPFSIGMVCGKSMQWVAGLALKDLNILPTSWFPLSSEQGTCFVQTPKSDLDVANVEEETLVIFDDCSYSGTQLFANLCHLEESLREHKKTKKLFIVIPFMSRAAIDKFEHCQLMFENDGFLSVELITGNERIETLNEIFSKDEYPKMTEICTAQLFSHFYTHLKLPGTTTLCWTDWRLPDPLSFERGFGSTCMLKPDLETPEFWIGLSEEEYFIPTEIPRPYSLVVSDDG